MNAAMTAETEKNNALVSVIVPAYNVEKYIARCLDSILTQTYTNLEVILIDDGSTDSTGRICDDYAHRDERVRVIHQVNQGLAEVRNIGIREAKGKWIQFVDSDDWIDTETIETCLRYAHEYNADMVIFQMTVEYVDGKKRIPNNKTSPRLKNAHEILNTIAFSSVSACNKFALASLYVGVKYPIGKLFEDIATTHEVIANARRILEISNAFYHCFLRMGSIVRSKFDKTKRDLAEGIQKFSDFITKYHNWNEQERNNIMVGVWLRKLYYINMMVKSGWECYDIDYINTLRKEIKPLLILKSPYMGLIQKMQLLILKFNLRLYSFIFLRLKRS